MRWNCLHNRSERPVDLRVCPSPIPQVLLTLLSTLYNTAIPLQRKDGKAWLPIALHLLHQLLTIPTGVSKGSAGCRFVVRGVGGTVSEFGGHGEASDLGHRDALAGGMG